MGIDGQVVDPVELAGVTAVPPKARQDLAGLAATNSVRKVPSLRKTWMRL
jgi:hypothetical protein